MPTTSQTTPLRQAIATGLFTPIGPYEHAVRVGHQVFISGTPGVDTATGQVVDGGAYAQTQQALANIQQMLLAAGCTLDNVATVQVNLVHVEDFAEMNRAYAEAFSAPYPARTVIGIAALPKAGARLTINATAIVAS